MTEEKSSVLGPTADSRPLARWRAALWMLAAAFGAPGCRERGAEVPPAAPSWDRAETTVGGGSGPRGAGSLDRVDCRSIRGWAWDSAAPDSTIQVDLYDGEDLLATVPAGAFRKDLLKNGKGDGKHGFVLETPARLKDGNAHTIGARVAGSGVNLAKSPRTVTCPKESLRP